MHWPQGQLADTLPYPPTLAPPSCSHEHARGLHVFCAPYPWVPKQLGEHHQVSRGEGEAHVGGGDGQHGHGVPLGQLELLAQLLPVCGGGGAIDADVLHLLRGQRGEASGRRL